MPQGTCHSWTTGEEPHGETTAGSCFRLCQMDLASGCYLVGRKVVQQLPDVVRVLGMPVVAGPGHTVSPGLWPLQHQAALHGLQHLQGLGARQPQGPLHKLGVSIRNWRSQRGKITQRIPGVGSRATPLSPQKASPPVV